MGTLPLRDYQNEMISAVENDWAAGIRRPALVAATGLGKTVIFTSLAADLVQRDYRPAVLVHRDELVKQTVNKIHEVAPGMTSGVIKGARHELGKDITVVSVASLHKSRLSTLPRNYFSHVIVDECHHASARSYVEILDWFGCFAEGSELEAGARSLGVTATMVRGDSKKLGDIWQKVSAERDILFGIKSGNLVDVKGQTCTIDGLDLAQVARSRGDYQDGALGNALEEAGASEAVVKGIREHAADRQGIVFAPTVATARLFGEALTDAGFPTEIILGTVGEDERTAIYDRVRRGETQFLSSCMVLTEGFDMPQLSVAAIVRPTANAGLYVQMAGRVLRPFAGQVPGFAPKLDALLLDFVGVTSRLPLACAANLVPGVETQPGESVKQAMTRMATEAPQILRGVLGGELTWEQVDLFHKSASAWLETEGGTRFIPTRTHLVFLWATTADNGLYKVGHTGTPYQMKGGGWYLDGEAMTLEMAMAWAESFASDLDISVADRGASWRRKGKPSDAQVDLAHRLGLPSPETMRKGELSDAISVTYANRIFTRLSR